MKKIGILLTNTGTPDAPTKKAVRRYLREFLSDKRIVQIPRFVWLPILYGLILPLRPKRSAKLYQEIWSADDSPMRTAMLTIAQHLQTHLNQLSHPCEYRVAIGMNYGNPSIKQALATFHDQEIDHLILLPLFPQYSNTTTASSFDRAVLHLKKWRALTHTTFIRDYATNEEYIAALAKTITAKWENKGRSDHLLISFHGIPERFVAQGDPYAKQCTQTANRLAAQLGLSAHEWTLCYQSQFGYDKWLKPSTQALLEDLPRKGHKNIEVICPGFSVDCLETLEEIALSGQKSFLKAGGESLDYIPALNTDHHHIQVLSNIVLSSLNK